MFQSGTWSNVITAIGLAMLIGFAFFTVQKKRKSHVSYAAGDVDVRLNRFENRVNDLQDILLSIDARLDRRIKKS